MSSNNVLTVSQWNPTETKVTLPKVNKSGQGKSINVISTKTNRSLYLNTPLMMTWGISDFTDPNSGVPDEKYTMTLNFPNDNTNPQTNEFLQKLKNFENFIIDEAVKNSEAWWGETMSRDIVKHMFFPFLKYPKDKLTKKTDYTKPPSIRAKVPYYDGKWMNVEIYDTRGNKLFPNDNGTTPDIIVQKLSSVACLLQCGGIWIGGKGWKLMQCILKPKESFNILGKCHIQLSAEDQNVIENQQINEDDTVSVSSLSGSPPAIETVVPVAVTQVIETPVVPVVTQVVAPPAPVVAPVVENSATHVADSDDEKAAPVAAAPTAVKKVVKKVVKKT
ncbi:hypothetical protein EBS43_12625 [bacterium]|nr:hypothetical protein [bacterium]